MNFEHLQSGRSPGRDAAVTETEACLVLVKHIV